MLLLQSIEKIVFIVLLRYKMLVCSDNTIRFLFISQIPTTKSDFHGRNHILDILVCGIYFCSVYSVMEPNKTLCAPFNTSRISADITIH